MSQQTSAGGGLKACGIALIIFGGVIYLATGGVDESVFAFLAVPFFAGGILLFYRGRQHNARAKAMGPDSPLMDSKPDVLYLRSFQTDPSTTYQHIAAGWTTEEEDLGKVLKPFGDMVAIGQPGERLPVPGATRMYANQSEWKQVVLASMQSAPLVIIRAGNSPGLLWEMGQAIRTLEPERLLIFVLNIKVQEYNLFANQIRGNFGLQLPAIEASSLVRAVIDRRESPSKAKPGFVVFESDWSAVFLPLPSTIIRTGYNDLTKAFSIALRPVFERHGIPWRAARRFGG
ncbi:MAG: hypothetical protein LAP86_20890 [Acidobacteriia bacterium]|nr:hypothetical protein [Terriglobia bacterium]